jgi:hypothetical protein
MKVSLCGSVSLVHEPVPAKLESSRSTETEASALRCLVAGSHAGRWGNTGACQDDLDEQFDPVDALLVADSEEVGQQGAEQHARPFR